MLTLKSWVLELRIKTMGGKRGSERKGLVPRATNVRAALSFSKESAVVGFRLEFLLL